MDGSDLTILAADFHRTACDCYQGEDCKSDFCNDSEVGGSDLAILVTDFDRAN